MRDLGARGFKLRVGDIRRDVLVPRYYDPRIEAELTALGAQCELISLGELVRRGWMRHDHGKYVPKIFYGTGPYPYIRTSDLANWEIKASPKHGVSQEVYAALHARQDVRPEDVLFVHEGTYLIGAVGMVTSFDGPILYQHHLAKFRMLPGAPFSSYYLLAALESPPVHRQVRSKQFTADVIDSVVGRLEEVVIPYPRDPARLTQIEQEVRDCVLGRAELRVQLSHTVDAVDRWCRGDGVESLHEVWEWQPNPQAERAVPAFLGGRQEFVAFTVKHDGLTSDILLPKYYNPMVRRMAPLYEARCNLVSIEQLLRDGVISVTPGDEIGRLNYGTGSIPFIRTSDFGSWELKREAKQGVSEDVYAVWQSKQDVRPYDILLVRDGTYLVGTSVLVHEHDLPVLYCGGVLRIRCLKPEVIHPALLFCLLNLPFVRRQMRDKQFARDIIETLGHRLREIVIPIPRDAAVQRGMTEQFDSKLVRRGELRVRLQRVVKNLMSANPR